MAQNTAKNLNDREKALESVDAAVFKDLIPKQKIFVLEYLKELNQTRAAIAAGYAENSATVTACRLMQHPAVKEAITQARLQINKKMQYSVEKSIENTRRYIDEAREAEQYNAVAQLQKHLDAVTGVYDPNKMEIDINAKNGFNLFLGGLKKPDYAQEEENEQIDVTPQKALNNGSKVDE